MAQSQFNNEEPKDPKKKHQQPSPYNPKPKNNYKEQHEASMGKSPANNPHEKPKQGPKGTPNKPKGYPTDHLFKKMEEHKKSVKVEPLKKKTTESVLKEKMDAKEKLKKKSPASRARTPLPKTKKKKK